MTIILEQYPVPDAGPLRLDVTIEANIEVTADEALRSVSRLLLNEVSYLMWGEQPALVVSAKQIVWRVPVHISLVGVGQIGPLAAVDVSVETGEIEPITPELIQEMKQRVQNLTAGQPLQTEPVI